MERDEYFMWDTVLQARHKEVGMVMEPLFLLVVLPCSLFQVSLSHAQDTTV
jgi:hypothetical protein